ncbi:MAG: iron-sulfur cluster assembly scaffold protein [Candidatus Cloacimonadota bacterium]|nr:MAG: iron-sulfur cluster assembly scaffold protein [Candidatus Cloacimonadota bacterium]
MPLPYSEKLLEYFRHPKNVGKMENPDAKAKEGSPACGDMVTLYLKVDEKTKKITDIKFESFGCASNIATGSIITELAKGKTLEEARKITWKDAAKELGGLPPVKVHCSVLAVDVLRSAIEDYEERHGLVKEKVETTKEIVLKRLKHVVNPIVGLDVVKTNIVKNIDVTDGVVRMLIDLPRDHQFAKNIEEEIIERLEHLWDIKKVEVTFGE